MADATSRATRTGRNVESRYDLRSSRAAIGELQCEESLKAAMLLNSPRQCGGLTATTRTRPRVLEIAVVSKSQLLGPATR